MLTLGPLAFTAPLVLLALAGLPLLWWWQRAVPPAPVRQRFAGTFLLHGLRERRTESQKSPWWLVLLRLFALAALIIGFAGPVLNPPAPKAGIDGQKPLLIVFDGGWADAADWPQRLARADALLWEAARMERPVALIRLSDAPKLDEAGAPAPIQWQNAPAARTRLAALTPQPWAAQDMAAWAAALPEGLFESFWLSDGTAHSGRRALYAALTQHGPLTVWQSAQPLFALAPPRFDGGDLTLRALRLEARPRGGTVQEHAVTTKSKDAAEERGLPVVAEGPAPSGGMQALVQDAFDFAPDAPSAEVTLTLPPELRNRITRFALAGLSSAGAVSIGDDRFKRPKVALISEGTQDEGSALLTAAHYLRNALATRADLIEGQISDVLRSAPDTVILTDNHHLTSDERSRLQKWTERGGTLLRFAGPRLAVASHGGAPRADGDEGAARRVDDPLLPVALRQGGRNLNGAMTWETPKTLATFPKDSPFFGLPIAQDVQVKEQVLAAPSLELSARTIAALSDGTPLVTRKTLGLGSVVLFHVSATPEWSDLPLSQMFLAMLERLSVAARPQSLSPEDITAQDWHAEQLLNGFGALHNVSKGSVIVAGDALNAALSRGPSPAVPPGIYSNGTRRIALNVITAHTQLRPAVWPENTTFEGQSTPPVRGLKGLFLATAFLAFLADSLAVLILSGRFSIAFWPVRFGRAARQNGAARQLRAALIPALLCAASWGALPLIAPPVLAQSPDDFALQASRELVLAHVRTGDTRIDQMAHDGLDGLSQLLRTRTSIAPGPPLDVDIETDELAFFPLLYWPISPAQPLPSPQAYRKLNAYLQHGGMILFDTRDAGDPNSLEAAHLMTLAEGLRLPPLEPLRENHVLSRSFYLLQDFPGRYAGGTLWVDAPPRGNDASANSLPTLNDGVSPVVIGSADWAAAWAGDPNGPALFPVGFQQREMAYRFGVNLVMYALSGNYKADQVHLPALLDRLGQP